MKEGKMEYLYHLERKGYLDGFSSEPDVILTQYASFDASATWMEVLISFSTFLNAVYGYDISDRVRVKMEEIEEELSGGEQYETPCNP
jgi:hypothetical protein